MADEPRLTKKERRAKAREERRLEEERKAREARMQTIRSSAISVAVLGAIGAAVYFAATGNTSEGEIQIDPELASSARDAAECEVLDVPELPDRDHLDPAIAPPADVLYPDLRPTHSGQHFPTTFPVQADGVSTQPDERNTTHNMEHGAIIAWYDPDTIDGGELDDWAEARNDAGFLENRAGVAIFSAPYTDPGLPDGVGVAFRAWGVAMDCGTWDQTVADAWVIDHYGTHGIGPERNFAPFPEEALSYSDGSGEGDSEAPLDEDPEPGEPQDDPADDGGGEGDLEEMVPDDEEPAEDGDDAEPADGEG